MYVQQTCRHVKWLNISEIFDVIYKLTVDFTKNASSMHSFLTFCRMLENAHTHAAITSQPNLYETHKIRTSFWLLKVVKCKM